MKPLRLTMQAFGPFAGKETVDFSQLPERAPFSISGPTGAGKTSVLDGLCLALFGETSGGERKPAETRSHHADPKLPTEVVLEFALGSDVWRVTRRPPRKSEGKDETQSAQLDRQLGPDSWQPCLQRVRDVDQKIVGLLGFDVSQFRQVVVLPQGAFRELLSANSTQREAILKQLFGTHLYEKVQEELNQRSMRLGGDIKVVNDKRTTLLQTHAVESVDALTVLQATAREEQAAAEQKAMATKQLRQVTQAALQTGTRHAELLREAADAAQKLQAHLADEAQQQARQIAIAAAVRAQQVEAKVQLAAAAADQAAKAAAAVLAAEKLRDTLVPQQAAAAALSTTQRLRAPQRDAELAEATRLEGLRAKVANLDLARDDAGKLTAAHTLALAQQGRASGEVQRLTVAVPKLRAELQQLQTTAAGLQGRVAVVEKLQRVQSLQSLAQAEASQLSKLQGQLLPQQGKVDTASKQAQASLAAYDAGHLAWVRGQAARLATELVAGEPCAVCGSPDHPAPATQAGEVPSDAALELLKRTYDNALTAWTGQQQALAVLQAALDTQVQAEAKARADVVAEGIDPALATAAAVALAVASVQAAKQCALDQDAAQAQVVQGEAALSAAAQAVTEADKRCAELAAQVAASGQRIGELELELPEPLRSAAALDTAIARCKAAAAAIEKAIDAAQTKLGELETALATAMANVASAQAALQDAQVATARTLGERDTALSDQQFATLLDWQAASLAPAALAQRQAQVQEWANLRAQRQALADQAALAAQDLVAPDVQDLKAKADHAQTADTEAHQAITRWQQTLGHITQTVTKLDQLELERGDLETRYAVVKLLASSCNGDNPKGLPLQRFVLAGLLDDVLRAANVRLTQMTRGRYSLLRKEEITDKRRSFGLDMEVVDAYTGQQRSATTLSGGEGFLASLALALGLSDVVQGYAGGIRLDALFIDEGFGTLDPEVLELAIQVLVELTSGPEASGRMVGVISHVPELKARLAKGIAVAPRADGKGSQVVMVG